MRKFDILFCNRAEENPEYDGFTAVLCERDDVTNLLFFPISDSYAKLVNSILKKSSEGDKDEEDNNKEKEKEEENKLSNEEYETLDVYNTMSRIWMSSDLFLSGILFP